MSCDSLLWLMLSIVLSIVDIATAQSDFVDNRLLSIVDSATVQSDFVESDSAVHDNRCLSIVDSAERLCNVDLIMLETLSQHVGNHARDNLVHV